MVSGMRISSLHTYPVKGCHRLDHREAELKPWGLAGDRRWMIVDADGVGFTQRRDPALTALRPEPYPGGLILRAPDLPDLDVPEPVDGPDEGVRVFSHKPPAPARVAARATDWCTRLLGRPARLVWQADPAGRPVQSHGRDGDHVSLADGYPILVTNSASLDAVNDWLVDAGDDPVPMTRFRPNVVVCGAGAWAEDGWLGRRLRIGGAILRAVRPKDRCVVTTIDQETGEKGRQPLQVLGRRRKFDDGLLFGLNLIPDETAVLRVGDPVTLLS